MNTSKSLTLLTLICGLLYTCAKAPQPWTGPRLTQPRDQLQVEQLLADSLPGFVDMSYYARPAWAETAKHRFSGTISFGDQEIAHPQAREPYEGENIFPGAQLEFISQDGALIPRQKQLIRTPHDSQSLWDIIVGTGRVWQEARDEDWSRASFPLTLTERYMGQTRNCVATFVYRPEAISNLCVQCSQETADINDQQLGDIQVVLAAQYQAKSFADSAAIMARHIAFEDRKLPVLPLSAVDTDGLLSAAFTERIHTSASTSIGAILMGDKLYSAPPQTRHGAYPYPDELRSGVYSVTKSLAGALALFYLAERYGEEILNAPISAYVPALADHPGWQGVTFAHTLNMATGTIGSEEAQHLLHILVLARSAEEAINNIASLGDAEPPPGAYFNYASTNFFVLSYAMQKYVEAQEGPGVNYWDLVQRDVLQAIGADYFSLRLTVENDSTQGIPILAYGARPTLDEAAKIARLLIQEGTHEGRQLLHRKTVQEALGRSSWSGYDTRNDFRGARYRHSFWSRTIRTAGCEVEASYMLGFGANYVVFLPSDVVVFRFMDEFDMDVERLVRGTERVKSSCN